MNCLQKMRKSSKSTPLRDADSNGNAVSRADSNLPLSIAREPLMTPESAGRGLGGGHRQPVAGPVLVSLPHH